MKITKTEFEELVIIEPDVYMDSRGSFHESFNSKKYILNDVPYFFVQDNEAESIYGVIRGLHFQTRNTAQAKLIRVSFGEVLDIAIDLRKDSNTYGKVFSIILNDENKKQVLIPRGFAHGYSVLSPRAIFNYKCDNYYSKADERGINPTDPGLQIDWQIPTHKRIISDKDLQLPFFTH